MLTEPKLLNVISLSKKYDTKDYEIENDVQSILTQYERECIDLFFSKSQQKRTQISVLLNRFKIIAKLCYRKRSQK